MMIAGIDGGGTKVECVIVTEHGDIVGRAVGGSVNTNFSPAATVIESFEDAIGQALAQAGSRGSEVGTVVVGSPTNPNVLDQVIAVWFPMAKWVSVGEGRLALAAGGVIGQGVAVISGTGSMAYGRDREGRQVSVGGWGTLLGDEGSAYDIGVESLRAACRAVDGRTLDTRLTERIKAQFGLEHLRDLTKVVYGPPMLSRTQIGALSRLVAEVAETGDEIADEILRTAGHRLADLVPPVVRRIGLDVSDVIPVVASGSVLQHNPVVFEAMAEAVELSYPLANVRQTPISPGVGAAVIAMERLGLEEGRMRLLRGNAKATESGWDRTGKS